MALVRDPGPPPVMPPTRPGVLADAHLPGVTITDCEPRSGGHRLPGDVHTGLQGCRRHRQRVDHRCRDRPLSTPLRSRIPYRLPSLIAAGHHHRRRRDTAIPDGRSRSGAGPHRPDRRPPTGRTGCSGNGPATATGGHRTIPQRPTACPGRAPRFRPVPDPADGISPARRQFPNPLTA